MLWDAAGERLQFDFVAVTVVVFLTPPSFGYLPYILLCTTQGRRIAKQPFSLYCFVVPRNAAGHGRGRDCDLILLLLLSLFFLTPPSFGHLPYILRCKTQGRRIEKQPFSLYCFVVPRNAAGHGRGRDCDLILLLLLSLFFLTPPSFGHLPYILRCKTQGRRIEKRPLPYIVL